MQFIIDYCSQGKIVYYLILVAQNIAAHMGVLFFPIWGYNICTVQLHNHLPFLCNILRHIAFRKYFISITIHLSAILFRDFDGPFFFSTELKCLAAIDFNLWCFCFLNCALDCEKPQYQWLFMTCIRCPDVEDAKSNVFLDETWSLHCIWKL